MTLIDTHAHLNFSDFQNDLDGVLERAKQKGVEKIIVPSANKSTALESLNLSAKYPQIYSAIGVHPFYLAGAGGLFTENGSPIGFYLANGSKTQEVFHLNDFKQMLKNNKVVAIGEVGLDYFESSTRPTKVNKKAQSEILFKILGIALESNKPLILHIRPTANSMDAFLDLIKIAGKFSPLPRSVIHCYSGNWKIAQKLISLGFFLSFTQMTFYSQGSLETFAKTPLQRIMIETDSPFLSPYKEQKRNEPAFLKKIAKELAYAKGITLEELSSATSQTAKEFFNI